MTISLPLSGASFDLSECVCWGSGGGTPSRGSLRGRIPLSRGLGGQSPPKIFEFLGVIWRSIVLKKWWHDGQQRGLFPVVLATEAFHKAIICWLPDTEQNCTQGTKRNLACSITCLKLNEYPRNYIFQGTIRSSESYSFA